MSPYKSGYPLAGSPHCASQDGLIKVACLALPGLWKPHRSRIPIPGRSVRYPSQSQSGRRGGPFWNGRSVDSFQKTGMSEQLVRMSLTTLFLIAFSFKRSPWKSPTPAFSKWTSRLPISGDTMGLHYQNLGSPWAFDPPCPSQKKRVYVVPYPGAGDLDAVEGAKAVICSSHIYRSIPCISSSTCRSTAITSSSRVRSRGWRNGIQRCLWALFDHDLHGINCTT
jgi:hypothetical protein